MNRFPKKPLEGLPPPRGNAPEPVVFEEEIPTKKTGQDLATYQALLSVFDSLDRSGREDFVEFASIFSGMSRSDREALLDLIRRSR